MLGRIDAVLAAGEHGDVLVARLAAMCGRINATRQPGDDGEAGFAEFARDHLREFQPGTEALREPTTATRGSASAATLPRRVMSGGASSIICSRSG